MRKTLTFTGALIATLLPLIILWGQVFDLPAKRHGLCSFKWGGVYEHSFMHNENDICITTDPITGKVTRSEMQQPIGVFQ